MEPIIGTTLNQIMVLHCVI